MLGWSSVEELTERRHLEVGGATADPVWSRPRATEETA